ncbi:hypothetical protein OG257_03925 [Streptomyces sp. NBC_00683]|uniref:hypothetical protein n=1 Tax=Streptomyces sp. NBC_00683 TaxID=2903670 RepID=UPI002E36A540|nr:hypothetical protein [Streptomyces sp. NBC_00683]
MTPQHRPPRNPPQPPREEPAPDAARATAAQGAARHRIRRRYAGRIITGYLLLAVLVSAGPSALNERVAGHLSVASLLVLLHLALVLWALLSHRRSAARLDTSVKRLRNDLADDTHRAAW